MEHADGEPRASSHKLIWWGALGYGATYVPYAALTKVLSDGRLESLGPAHSGLSLLPVSVLASLATTVVLLAASGWWRRAGRRKLGPWQVPCPGRWTFVSGLCSAVIIATTTLAYTFTSASILRMMLLMRGGVLVMAPLVDALGGRRVRPAAWGALAFCGAGVVVVGMPGEGGLWLPLVAALDVGAYLLAYFVRLSFMSRNGKSNDAAVKWRYFVEEMMTSTPALVVLLALGALLAPPALSAPLREGFAMLTGGASVGLLAAVVLVGVLSSGTGVFGAVVLLDPRETAFCIPVNRASSVVAGALASALLALLPGVRAPYPREWLAAALVLGAVALLGYSELRKQRVVLSEPVRTRA